MKRITMYLTGGLAILLAIASVPAAAEFSLYGRVVSGIIHDNPEVGDDQWDIGTVDAGNANSDAGGTGDRLFSRIGVRVSNDLGNGMSAGAHVEKRLDGWRTRMQNVWLEGAVGRITLGQQSLPYYGAVSWDGANFTGGTWDHHGIGSRGSGISFNSNLGGPFNFGAMLLDTANSGAGTSDDAVNEYQLAASFDIGEFATFGLGYVGRDDDLPYEAGGTLGGSAGDLSWEIGYQTVEDDNDLYGFHVGYGVGGGNLYAQWEDYNHDTNDDADDRIVIVGYSYVIGPGTRVIAEHKNQKEGSDRSILALRVDF